METLCVEQSVEERLQLLEMKLRSLEEEYRLAGDGAGKAAQKRLRPDAATSQADSLCLVVFSGDLDKVLAALTMATGAAAMGTDVCLFFTFWGTTFLRRSGKRPARARAAAPHTGAVSSESPRPVIDRALGRMLPRGGANLKLSRMNMGGLGTALIKRRMREKRIADCDELLEMARQSGVKIRVCEMSMDLMGIASDDLIDYPGLDRCGVATFMERALDSCVTLFV